jgi:hypothetical protein
MGRRIVHTEHAADAYDVGRPEGAATPPDLTPYWDRIKDLIPTEVSALYIAGVGVIPKAETVGILVWAVVCLGLVVLVIARQTQTADRRPGTRYTTDWAHVVISSVSFVIWVYALGGPFAAFGWHVAWIGALTMLFWTFVVPYFYAGKPDDEDVVTP